MEALCFLGPGVCFAIGALANVAKYERSLTTVGTVSFLTVGTVLTVLGVSSLMELLGPWHHFFGNATLGIGMVVLGIRKLYIIPPSDNLRHI
jgi:hypothetical protein